MYNPVPNPNHVQCFKTEFPGWSILWEKVTEKRFTLRDVKGYIGITKEQVYYWIKKGVLSSENKVPHKWQWFSLIDLFLFATAYKLRLKGVEVSNMPSIRNGILAKYGYNDWNFALVYIVRGNEVFLYSDLEDFVALRCFDDKDMEEKLDRGDLTLELVVREDTFFFVCVSLKKICDELARKLKLKDFRINVLSNGRYEFIINQVPLKLESLRDEDVRERFKGEEML